MVGVIYSIALSFIGSPVTGIITSNLLAGFMAVVFAHKKEGYIINGGVSGILSTLIMLIVVSYSLLHLPSVAGMP